MFLKHGNGNIKGVCGSQLGQGQNSSSTHFNCNAMQDKINEICICLQLLAYVFYYAEHNSGAS